MHSRKRNNPPHHPFICAGTVVFVACFLFFRPSPSQAAFTIEHTYQQAIPDFVDAITDATRSVKDDAELNGIFAWEQDSRARLPEFLQDLIEIAKELEANGNPDFSVEKYEEFAAKWDTLSQTYPGLNELQPVLGPIIEQLLNGLPELEATSNGSPVGDLYDLYVKMAEVNPWFVNTLWHIPVIEHAHKVSTVKETAKETTVGGYKSIDIVGRNILVQLNNEVVFHETIENGEIVNTLVAERDPSVVHETLQQMIDHGGAQREIEIIREWADLIDVHLKTALQNHIIDDCSYSFVYRKKLGGKATCTDVNGEEQDFAALSKYSPFDHVNRVELTRVDPLAKVTRNITGIAAAANPLLEPVRAQVSPVVKQIEEIVPPPLRKLVNEPELQDIPPTGPIPTPVPPEPVMITPLAPPPPAVPPMEAMIFLTPAYLWTAIGFRLF